MRKLICLVVLGVVFVMAPGVVRANKWKSDSGRVHLFQLSRDGVGRPKVRRVLSIPYSQIADGRVSMDPVSGNWRVNVQDANGKVHSYEANVKAHQSPGGHVDESLTAHRAQSIFGGVSDVMEIRRQAFQSLANRRLLEPSQESAMVLHYKISSAASRANSTEESHATAR